MTQSETPSAGIPADAYSTHDNDDKQNQRESDWSWGIPYRSKNRTDIGTPPAARTGDGTPPEPE